MKGCILVAMVLLFLGCNKDDPNPIATDDSPVHLAGVVLTSTNQVASYWEDGVYSDLTKDSTSSAINSMYVDESSVLIGGSISREQFSYQRSVIWQNGNETIIKDTYRSATLVALMNDNLVGVWRDDSLGWVYNKNNITQPIPDSVSITPTAIAVMGDDLFIAGNAHGHDYVYMNHPDQYAQCWKNGQLIFRESVRSHVTSIFTYQNDVYMAGYLTASYPGADTACYWKNGHRINLKGGNLESIATSIFVTNTNVYVSGDLDFQAAYWKDGVATIVAYGGGSANAIFVKGVDVYVAGSYYADSSEEHPAYWKNGIRQKIPNQDKQGHIDFIAVGSN